MNKKSALKLFNPLGWIGLSKDSHQFQPGLAEIEEKPLNPLGPFVLWSVIALLGLIVAWLCIGEVDVVVSARGKIVPKGQLKVVQSLEGGVVRRLLAEPGQWVKQGQPLLEIEPDTLEPDYLATQQTLAYTQAEQRRLNSQLSGGPDGGLSATQQILRQRALAQIQAKLNAKRQELRQIQVEQASAQNEATETKTLLASAKAQWEQLAPVADLVARQEVQQAQDKVTELRTRAQTLSHKWDELQAREQQILREEAALQAETEEHWLTELSQREKTVLELSARQRELGFRRKKQVLTAPVSGMVNQRFLNTVGGVVKPAEPIFTIVPKDTPVQVEVQMATRDSGYVKPGMKAMIKLDTFEYTKYGTVPAKVTEVGADTVQVKNQEHYPVWIMPTQNYILVKGKREPLRPGMSLMADVTTSRRKLIEFILYPVISALSETASLR